MLAARCNDRDFGTVPEQLAYQATARSLPAKGANTLYRPTRRTPGYHSRLLSSRLRTNLLGLSISARDSTLTSLALDVCLPKDPSKFFILFTEKSRKISHTLRRERPMEWNPHPQYRQALAVAGWCPRFCGPQSGPGVWSRYPMAPIGSPR